MSHLSLDGVSVSYNGRRVLDGADLEAHPGSWVGLIGPNGAGKSTLLKAVAGLVAYSGMIEIGGREISTLGRRSLSREVAYLPQRPVMPEGVTVTDYVAIGRTPYIPYWGTESVEDREVVAKVLARLDLERLARRHVDALSGGEAQRVVLARALAQEALLLLLDEPTSALDVGHQQQVLELIDQLRLEQGLTVLSALHDLTLAGQFAQRLILLDGGKVAADAAPVDVLSEERVMRHFGALVRVFAEPDGTGISVSPIRSANRQGDRPSDLDRDPK